MVSPSYCVYRPRPDRGMSQNCQFVDLAKSVYKNLTEWRQFRAALRLFNSVTPTSDWRVVVKSSKKIVFFVASFSSIEATAPLGILAISTPLLEAGYDVLIIDSTITATTRQPSCGK